MVAYTFCIDSMIRGYHEYWKKVSTDQSIWDNPLADGYFVNEKFTQSTGHGYQEMFDGTPAASCWARA